MTCELTLMLFEDFSQCVFASCVHLSTILGSVASKGSPFLDEFGFDIEIGAMKNTSLLFSLPEAYQARVDFLPLHLIDCFELTEMQLAQTHQVFPVEADR